MQSNITKEVIAGVQVEVFVAGAGKPLLYLHAADGLEGATDLLDELSRNFRVHALSHPGFGASDRPRDLNSVGDLAYFYLDAIEEVGIRDGVLVGTSFGGWIGAEIAVRDASRFSHLVLGAPMGVKIGDRESSAIADLLSMTDAQLAACLYCEAQSPPDYARLQEEQLARLVRNRESLALFGWSPTLYNPKLRQRLHRIRIPTLLLWGDSDRVLDPQYVAEYGSAIPYHLNETITSAGHYLHADRPKELAAATERFVLQQ